MKKLKGWTIRLTDRSEGYCWRKDKRIDLGLKNENPLRLLLHEVAHIDIYPQGNKHNQEWFDEYLALMRKYMPGIDISESDKIIQKTYGLKIYDTRDYYCPSCKNEVTVTHIEKPFDTCECSECGKVMVKK